MRARIQSWAEYRRWTCLLFDAAADLHRRVGFDITHHVTYATWRLASPLWRLPVPFIWGPVGGNEQMGINFWRMLSQTAKAFEAARTVASFLGHRSKSIRECCKKSAHVFAANPETLRLVRELRRNTRGTSMLSAAFFSDQEAKRFAASPSDKNFNGEFRIFAGGNLEGRKGVSLALHGLDRAKQKGARFRYMLGGRGPELVHLQTLAGRLGLEGEVVFGDALRGDAYAEELKRTHIYLLPSLRENAGLTLMEAMLAGCVPIVADCGGPADIVTGDCGFKIRPESPDQVIGQVCETICLIARKPEIILKAGQAAASRIATAYSEHHYRDCINRVYQEAAKGGR
jgi:glycosyltransferase involved in cell wall biosynthesis